MKNWLVICVAAIAAFLIWEHIIKEPRTAETKHNLSVSGSPVDWLNNEQLLIEQDKRLIVYNVKNDQIDFDYKNIPDIASFSEIPCATKYGAILKFTKTTPVRYNYGGDPLPSAYYFPDPKNLENYKFIKEPQDTALNMQDVNLLDCGFYKHEQIMAQTVNVKDIIIKPIKEMEQLLRTGHGPTTAYIINGKTVVIAGTKQVSLDLVESYSSGTPLLSDYDEQKNEYLWYVNKRDFSIDPDDWSFKAWRISPDLKILEEYNLPPGPWVYKDGYASCFSCGCECYDRVFLKLKNSVIYAYVYGSGVKPKHRGIYRLNGDSWDPLVTDFTKYSDQLPVFHSIAVSSDNCRIAYGEGKISVVDVCH